MEIIIYHNPRCTKSRETLALLQAHGIEPTVVEYLKTPLALDDLHALHQTLGGTVRDMVRTKEPVYQALNLASAGDDKLLSAMAENPMLLERPIVVRARRAVIGRPPENALSLLTPIERKRCQTS